MDTCPPRHLSNPGSLCVCIHVCVCMCECVHMCVYALVCAASVRVCILGSIWRSAHVYGTVSGVAVLASFSIFPHKFEAPPGDSNACFHPSDLEPLPSACWGQLPGKQATVLAPSLHCEHPPSVLSLGTLVPGTGALSSPGVWALGLGSEGKWWFTLCPHSLPRWTKTEGGAPAK